MVSFAKPHPTRLTMAMRSRRSKERQETIDKGRRLGGQPLRTHLDSPETRWNSRWRDAAGRQAGPYRGDPIGPGQTARRT
jgi:hypothetical protein